MRRRRLLSSALVVLALLAAAPTALAAADPSVVRTTDGPVRGTITEKHRLFQGIPFAAPPTGERRWQPPAPVTPWTEVRDATKPGNVCPQRPLFSAGEVLGEEDCLFLNVSAPAAPSHRPRPVMVWIHGGMFTGGSGSDYPATQLAERGDVVVVTINYRLGALGFLSLPGLPGGGTFGLHDQQAALRWVRANARAFGGDAGNVTIFGESAGGLSVCAQLTSPTARGLFHRAITQSGPCDLASRDSEFWPGAPADSTWAARAEADKAGTDLAAGFRCTGDALACLHLKSKEELLTSTIVIDEPAFGTPLLPLNPAKAVAEGRVAPVPVMIGINRDEHRTFAALVPPFSREMYEAGLRDAYEDKADQVLAKYPTAAYASPTIAWATVSTDAVWAYTQHKIIGHLTRQVPTFAYEFRDRTVPPLLPNFPDMGAYHGAELPYLFPGSVPVQLNPTQQALGERMQRYWANFARTGQPNGPGLPLWLPSHPFAPTVQGLDIAPAGIGRVDTAAEHNYAFWTAL